MRHNLHRIPVAAQPYVTSLLETYQFRFNLKNNRLTKLGDFKKDRSTGNFTISVNKTLNPYQFLITFIHELAHLKVAQDHHRSRKAHGTEWKQAFQDLLAPLLHSGVFPEPILSALTRHMKNPKAAAGSDPKLWAALRKYDLGDTGIELNELKEGDRFLFKGRPFKKIKRRRTRVLCQEVDGKRLYLIPGVAPIEPIEN